MAKLIRDHIPGVQPEQTRSAEAFEIPELFRRKLAEEYDEFLAAPSGDEEVEELADLLEVVHSIIRRSGHSIASVEFEMEMKNHERGGFDECVVLIDG